MLNSNLLKSSLSFLSLVAVLIPYSALSANAQMMRPSLKLEMHAVESTELPGRSDELDKKIAPDLEEELSSSRAILNSEATAKVVIKMKSDLQTDLMLEQAADDYTRKLLISKERRGNREKAGRISSEIVALNGKAHKSFNNLGLVSAELPLSKIRELSQSENVEYISPDREIQSFGHIGATTGWTNPGIADKGDADPATWQCAAGMRIAVIDSGIDSNHTLLKWHSEGTTKKVIHEVDFTGQNISGDPYGHGTHVASMVTGDWQHHNFAYESPADGAAVLSLRVLNSTGTGNISNLIAALDWVVANKTNWDISVINLSLGTAARDSYRNDPLCQAARRAVNAGLVVVASAGNFGKDILGNKLYGTIGSPGIEPSVITVGAANTFGTDSRVDDQVASFSSRGPTRGYRMVNGARVYDNLIKPDLVAPGNRLIGARSYFNGSENLLASSFTGLRTGTDALETDKVMYMSGTSMAAPIVAGAAALLKEVNRNLTPNLIKAILMYTAQPLAGQNSLEQGAGLLNIDGAIRLARMVKTTVPSKNGSALLTSALPSSQTSVISGSPVYWGKGVVTNHGILQGNDLMNKWQGMYGNGVLIGDGTPFSGSSLTKSTSLTSGTLSLFQGAISNNGVLVGDGSMFLTAQSMGGTFAPRVNGQGVLVADGVLISDGILVGDGVLIGDGGAYIANSITGDNTACMLPAP